MLYNFRNDLFRLGEKDLHKSSSALFDEKKVKFATSMQDIEDGLLRLDIYLSFIFKTILVMIVILVSKHVIKYVVITYI